MTPDQTAANRLTDDEREAVLAKYEDLVWNLAWRWKRAHPSLDIDDLAAEIRFGFVEAAGRFDPSTGNVFSTYAGWYAMRAVRIFAKRELARGMKVRREEPIIYVGVMNLSQSGEEDADGDAMAEMIPAREPDHAPEFPPDFWVQLRAAVGHKREARVLEMYFREGMTHKQIGERLGITRSRTHQLHKRAMERLRRKGFGEGLLEAA